MKVAKIISSQKTNAVKKTVETSKKVYDKLGYEIGASGLPIEVPLEKRYYIASQRAIFERLKEANNAIIEKIKN